MVDQNPRQVLSGFLAPLLPENWKIVASERNIDTVDTTTVRLQQMFIRRAPGAPFGLHAIEFVATVASHYRDLEKAEDDLDDAMLAFTHALDEHPDIIFDEARKILSPESLMAYEVTLTLISQKD